MLTSPQSKNRTRIYTLRSYVRRKQPSSLLYSFSSPSSVDFHTDYCIVTYKDSYTMKLFSKVDHPEIAWQAFSRKAMFDPRWYLRPQRLGESSLESIIDVVSISRRVVY